MEGDITCPQVFAKNVCRKAAIVSIEIRFMLWPGQERSLGKEARAGHRPNKLAYGLVNLMGALMRKSKGTRLLLIGIGILLVLLGVRGLALGVVGKTATASVTRVEKAVGQQDDAMDHNYQISYRFALNGRNYSGGFTRKKVYNTATLPSVGSSVSVRYLAAWPAINGGPDSGPLGGIVLGLLGLFVMFAGVKLTKAQSPPSDSEIVNADNQG